MSARAAWGSESEREPVIIQIIPAVGWWACYTDGPAEPVQAFALLEASGRPELRTVASLVPEICGDSFAEDSRNFLRLEYRGPFATDAPEPDDEARLAHTFRVVAKGMAEGLSPTPRSDGEDAT